MTNIHIQTIPQYLDGSTYQITCNYSESTYTFQYWDHPDPGVADISVTRGRFQVVRARVGVHRLIISDTSENDAGEYKCVFERNSNQQEVAAAIVVEYRDPIVFHTQDLLSYYHQAGEETTLRCEADHVLRLFWLHESATGGSPVTIEPTPDGRIQFDGNNLVFRELLLIDNGTYRCLAENDLGHNNIRAHLFVFSKCLCGECQGLSLINWLCPV